MPSQLISDKEVPLILGLKRTLSVKYDIMVQSGVGPFSQEELIDEVKGIYAGLIMVKAKCIEVKDKQADLTQQDDRDSTPLRSKQLKALIALQRTLLQEHYHFFLASQHPSASPALRRLASKNYMPATTWRHGIHSSLELLRQQLPTSGDDFLSFIHLAYSMTASLYETVPAFEDIWIQCLVILAVIVWQLKTTIFAIGKNGQILFAIGTLRLLIRHLQPAH